MTKIIETEPSDDEILKMQNMARALLNENARLFEKRTKRSPAYMCSAMILELLRLHVEGNGIEDTEQMVKEAIAEIGKELPGKVH